MGRWASQRQRSHAARSPARAASAPTPSRGLSSCIMRAVLIVNPTATSTTPAGRDLLAHALKSRLELTVEHTNHRGHGTELAQARRRGRSRPGRRARRRRHGERGRQRHARPPRAAPPSGHVPAVAVVPGGSANVLARSLGISRDPVAATNQLIQLLDDYRRHQTWRRISLIDCGEQWAVINAGMGVDAEVVAAVEAQRDKGVKVNAVALLAGGDSRHVAFSPPRTDPHPGATRPRSRSGRALRLGVQHQSVDLQQQPADGDQPGLQLRIGPRRVRAHRDEGVSDAATGPPDPVEAAQAASQTTRPRRRRVLPANHLNRRPGRQPVRRRLPRPARDHDVPGGSRCAARSPPHPAKTTSELRRRKPGRESTKIFWRK